jgi:hypothetical protein
MKNQKNYQITSKNPTRTLKKHYNLISLSKIRSLLNKKNIIRTQIGVVYEIITTLNPYENFMNVLFVVEHIKRQTVRQTNFQKYIVG